jgi:hypothetical protein
MVALIGIGDRRMMMSKDDPESMMDLSMMEFGLRKTKNKPDRDYKKSSTSEIVALYCSRVKRFATLKMLKAPNPILEFETRLLAQAKRLLAGRGIRI